MTYPLDVGRYIGYKYLYLNNSKPKQQKNYFSNDLNIVVSFGGYDSRNLTSFVLRSIISSPRVLDSSISIDFLVSDEGDILLTRWREEVKQSFNSS